MPSKRTQVPCLARKQTQFKFDRREGLNLDDTFGCGQIFRWRRYGKQWIGLLKGSGLALQEKGPWLVADVWGKRLMREDLVRFLSLDEDLSVIHQFLRQDPLLSPLVSTLKGLRLLRQDPWECLASYICATQMNIPRIQKIVERLSRCFGATVCQAPLELFTFPAPVVLAKASVSDLVECGLGYRASYLHDTACLLASRKFSLRKIAKMDYQKAKDVLLKLPGVGPKVADCVLLFSMGKSEAFPVDVWIRRVMLEKYEKQLTVFCSKGKTSRPTYDQISRFASVTFGEYAGYAQQYLYFGRKEGLI